MALKWSTIQEFNRQGIGVQPARRDLGLPFLGQVILHLCPNMASGYVHCPARSVAPSFLPCAISWGKSKTNGEAEATPQEFGSSTCPLALWCLLTHAFHSLRFKEIVQSSKTSSEGGALLIHLWIHLAWCPAHRNYCLLTCFFPVQWTSWTWNPLPSTPLVVWPMGDQT